MSDKSWMLNAKAIAAARKCISIVEVELGIKLKLSNPDFLELLIEYVELNESSELEKALLVLAQYAPAKVQTTMIGNAEPPPKIVNLESKTAYTPQNRRTCITGNCDGFVSG